MDNNLLSTKFLLSVLGIVLMFVALMLKLVDAAMFRDLLYVALGFYSVANVVASGIYSFSNPTPSQKTTTSTTSVVVTPPTVVPDPSVDGVNAPTTNDNTPLE